MQPADYQARQAALDPTRSFAVTAPAGSGKTGLLTQRVLTLLATANEPEEILAITFTRKAAAEMQERISSALIQAASSNRPEAEHDQLTWDLAQSVLQRDQEQGWALLDNPGRLRIQTIDGLCRSITQFQPLASGLGGSTQMLDRPETAYQQAINQLFRLLESDESIVDQLQYLLAHLDNNLEATRDLLMSLLQRRDQWMAALMQTRDARHYLESVLNQLITESLQQLQQALGPLASDLCLAADFAAGNCRNDKPDSAICQLQGITTLPGTSCADLDQWRALTELLLTSSNSWRSSRGINKNVGFPTAKDKQQKALLAERKQHFVDLLEQLRQQPGLEEQLRVVRYLPPGRYPEQQWQLLAALTSILPRLVGELLLVFRQLNATDFIEVTQGALKALGDSESPTDTTLMLDYQIRHILVDEFQDTSTPQLQLLERLTAGWEAGDGRTLFIVGDGMQSCYGFRAANVGIFLDARNHGIGTVALEKLDLTVNFRSQAQIVNWVNDTFAEAFPERDDIARGAVRYSESEAFKPALEGTAVQCWGLLNTDNRLLEAETLCSKIRLTQSQFPTDSIAILVRNRGYLKAIIPALQAHQIQWQATDIEPLSGRMAITDLMTLTRALTHPGDRNAWLALLRTPWMGLNNSDLLTVAGLQPLADGQAGFVSLMPSIIEWLNDAASTPDLSPEGVCNLKRSVALIHHAWQSRRRKSLRQVIHGLWLALGGPAAATDSSDLNNAEDFFQLLQNYDEGGSLPRWQEFATDVERLYARPQITSHNPVQVMTIHKSKGLEFDHVFIPGIDKGARPDDHQLLLFQERINQDHEKQLLLGPLAPKGADADAIYNYLREEEKLKQKLEATRLFYVGCTRAIKRLHLLANLSKTDKGELKAPSPGSLLGPLWPVVKDEIIGLEDDSVGSTSGGDTAVTDVIYRLEKSWQRPALAISPLLQPYRGEEFDDEDNIPEPLSLHNHWRRHMGTILHQALCQVTLDGVAIWSSERIERQRHCWQVQLQNLGVTAQHLCQAVDAVTTGLTNTLDDHTGRWLLDNSHSDSQCEQELWQAGHTPRLSIVDRTFIDGDTRWIVDYKSSEPAPGQSLKQFLQQEVDEYRVQLQHYARLYQTQENGNDNPVAASKIQTALYFPMLKHLEAVEI
ncbi:MAG: UvrD-helicase domain-containing protein [Candidatus Pelagadaptatus aseana]|uniref:UvrD-helicase domain-containing protein n=1 Tax=Candidatus Pelagadaptatus aseana TaxID=3120508 RepID=UPI0039B28CB6